MSDNYLRLIPNDVPLPEAAAMLADNAGAICDICVATCERRSIMGGESYRYVVPYQFNVKEALERLRREVFASGEYHGAKSGAKNPEDALALAGEDGTRSILDIVKISQTPDYCAAAPLTPEEYRRYFGNTKPTLDMIDDTEDQLYDDMERGMARYVLAYDGDMPTHIVFVGISFD